MTKREILEQLKNIKRFDIVLSYDSFNACCYMERDYSDPYYQNGGEHIESSDIQALINLLENDRTD